MPMLEQAVRDALAVKPAAPEDKAVAALALEYAKQLDEGAAAEKVGPPLLAALEALHMSPRARGAAKKGTADDKPSANPLDELAARRAGLGNPAAVDAGAS